MSACAVKEKEIGRGKQYNLTGSDPENPLTGTLCWSHNLAKEYMQQKAEAPLPQKNQRKLYAVRIFSRLCGFLTCRADFGRAVRILMSLCGFWTCRADFQQVVRIARH